MSNVKSILSSYFRSPTPTPAAKPDLMQGVKNIIGAVFKPLPPITSSVSPSPTLIPGSPPDVAQKPLDQLTVGDAQVLRSAADGRTYTDPIQQQKIWAKQSQDALNATASPQPQVPLAQDIKGRMDKAASRMGIQNPASVGQVDQMFKTGTIPQLNPDGSPQAARTPEPNIIKKGVNAVEGLFKPQAQASNKPAVLAASTTPNLNPSIEKQVNMVPKDKQNNARAILQAMQANGTLTPNTAAYALATAQHESNFTPIDEIQAGPNDPPWLQNAQANYDGGWQYHGRGYTQLTGKANYDAIGKKIGVDLVNNPDLANDPKVAAKIMAEFLKSSGTNDYANKGDFVGARAGVNGGELTNGSPNPQNIAGYAQNYLNGTQ